MTRHLFSGFVAIVMLGPLHVPALRAADHRDSPLLFVDQLDGDPFGVALGDEFRGFFIADESILSRPDGVHEGQFLEFDLTIGEVNWNERQIVESPQFLIENGQITGVGVTITRTIPTHPDLNFFLPESPGRWWVEDARDASGAPVFGGNFGGTYALEFVPEVPEPTTAVVFAVLGIMCSAACVRPHRTRIR